MKFKGKIKVDAKGHLIFKLTVGWKYRQSRVSVVSRFLSLKEQVARAWLPTSASHLRCRNWRFIPQTPGEDARR